MDKINDSITELLRQEILDKRTNSLVKLESERTYEAKYQVGRQRIRTVINNLILEGLLVKNEGGATYILPQLRFRSLRIIYPSNIRISDPFYNNLWLNLSTLAVKLNVNLSFVPLEEALNCDPGDPVVLIAIQDPLVLRRLCHHFQYVVGVQTYARGIDMVNICFDNKKIGYAATKALLAYGHRNLVCVAGPAQYNSASLRKEGFIKACMRFHAKCSVFESKMNWTGGYSVGSEILEALKHPNRPTAAFVANDWMAIGLIQYLKEHGVSVPDDFSVISVDNVPIAEQIFPALTTFSQDMSMLTAQIFATVDQITPETYAGMTRKRIVIPHILISRQTLSYNKGAKENG